MFQDGLYLDKLKQIMSLRVYVNWYCKKRGLMNNIKDIICKMSYKNS